MVLPFLPFKKYVRDAYLLNFSYRQRFGLYCIGFAALVAALVFVLTIHDFLAISRPVVGNVLVVEGWIWNSSGMKDAAEEFRRGHYQYLVTVGGQAESDGVSSDQESSADLAARRLQEFGIAETSITVLRVPAVTIHRTYASALTLKDWLTTSKIKATGINVVTLGAHARKSLIIFRRTIGPTIEVGVISGTDNEYDPHRWWLSPRGIYVITRKALGYLYAIVWPMPENLLNTANSSFH